MAVQLLFVLPKLEKTRLPDYQIFLIFFFNFYVLGLTLLTLLVMIKPIVSPKTTSQIIKLFVISAQICCIPLTNVNAQYSFNTAALDAKFYQMMSDNCQQASCHTSQDQILVIICTIVIILFIGLVCWISYFLGQEDFCATGVQITSGNSFFWKICLVVYAVWVMQPIQNNFNIGFFIVVFSLLLLFLLIVPTTTDIYGQCFQLSLFSIVFFIDIFAITTELNMTIVICSGIVFGGLMYWIKYYLLYLTTESAIVWLSFKQKYENYVEQDDKTLKIEHIYAFPSIFVSFIRLGWLLLSFPVYVLEALLNISNNNTISNKMWDFIKKATKIKAQKLNFQNKFVNTQFVRQLMKKEVLTFLDRLYYNNYIKQMTKREIRVNTFIDGQKKQNINSMSIYDQLISKLFTIEINFSFVISFLAQQQVNLDQINFFEGGIIQKFDYPTIKQQCLSDIGELMRTKHVSNQNIQFYLCIVMNSICNDPETAQQVMKKYGFHSKRKNIIKQKIDGRIQLLSHGGDKNELYDQLNNNWEEMENAFMKLWDIQQNTNSDFEGEFRAIEKYSNDYAQVVLNFDIAKEQSTNVFIFELYKLAFVTYFEDQNYDTKKAKQYKLQKLQNNIVHDEDRVQIVNLYEPDPDNFQRQNKSDVQIAIVKEDKNYEVISSAKVIAGQNTQSFGPSFDQKSECRVEQENLSCFNRSIPQKNMSYQFLIWSSIIIGILVACSLLSIFLIVPPPLEVKHFDDAYQQITNEMQNTYIALTAITQFNATQFHPFSIKQFVDIINSKLTSCLKAVTEQLRPQITLVTEKANIQTIIIALTTAINLFKENQYIDGLILQLKKLFHGVQLEATSEQYLELENQQYNYLQMIGIILFLNELLMIIISSLTSRDLVFVYSLFIKIPSEIKSRIVQYYKQIQQNRKQQYTSKQSNIASYLESIIRKSVEIFSVTIHGKKLQTNEDSENHDIVKRKSGSILIQGIVSTLLVFLITQCIINVYVVCGSKLKIKEIVGNNGLQSFDLKVKLINSLQIIQKQRTLASLLKNRDDELEKHYNTYNLTAEDYMEDISKQLQQVQQISTQETTENIGQYLIKLQKIEQLTKYAYCENVSTCKVSVPDYVNSQIRSFDILRSEDARKFIQSTLGQLRYIIDLINHNLNSFYFINDSFLNYQVVNIARDVMQRNFAQFSNVRRPFIQTSNPRHRDVVLYIDSKQDQYDIQYSKELGGQINTTFSLDNSITGLNTDPFDELFMTCDEVIIVNAASAGILWIIAMIQFRSGRAILFAIIPLFGFSIIYIFATNINNSFGGFNRFSDSIFEIEKDIWDLGNKLQDFQVNSSISLLQNVEQLIYRYSSIYKLGQDSFSVKSIDAFPMFEPEQHIFANTLIYPLPEQEKINLFNFMKKYNQSLQINIDELQDSYTRTVIQIAQYVQQIVKLVQITIASISHQASLTVPDDKYHKMLNYIMQYNQTKLKQQLTDRVSEDGLPLTAEHYSNALLVSGFCVFSVSSCKMQNSFEMIYNEEKVFEGVHMMALRFRKIEQTNFLHIKEMVQYIVMLKMLLIIAVQLILFVAITHFITLALFGALSNVGNAQFNIEEMERINKQTIEKHQKKESVTNFVYACIAIGLVLLCFNYHMYTSNVQQARSLINDISAVRFDMKTDLGAIGCDIGGQPCIYSKNPRTIYLEARKKLAQIVQQMNSYETYSTYQDLGQYISQNRFSPKNYSGSFVEKFSKIAVNEFISSSYSYDAPAVFDTTKDGASSSYIDYVLSRLNLSNVQIRSIQGQSLAYDVANSAYTNQMKIIEAYRVEQSLTSIIDQITQFMNDRELEYFIRGFIYTLSIICITVSYQVYTLKRIRIARSKTDKVVELFKKIPTSIFNELPGIYVRTMM